MRKDAVEKAEAKIAKLVAVMAKAKPIPIELQVEFYGEPRDPRLEAHEGADSRLRHYPPSDPAELERLRVVRRETRAVYYDSLNRHLLQCRARDLRIAIARRDSERREAQDKEADVMPPHVSRHFAELADGWMPEWVVVPT